MKTVRLLGGTFVLLAMMVSSSCTRESSSSTSPDSSQQATGASEKEGRASRASFQEGRDYTVLERVRFMDNAGFEQPAEAFSVLLPRGWKHEGGVVWKGPQECRGEMVGARVTISSPDGAIRFQSLPVHAWGYASDSMMLQSMYMQARAGGCDVEQPMGAEAYLRQVMVPRELAGATVIEVRPNEPAQRALQSRADENRAKLMQYGAKQVDFGIDSIIARVRWEDGSEGLVLCSVVNIISTTQNAFTGELQRLTNSSASDRSWIRFPPDRRTEAEMVLANLKSSYRTNPEWQSAVDGYMVRLRNAQDVEHHRRMTAIADQTAANARAHAQRMADIRAQGAANTQRHEGRMAAMDQSMRSWEARQSSQDRMHTSFVQAIREVETWRGADGGVELSSGYDHAWSRGDGTYVMSNSPSFDPRAVFQDQSWEELRREKP
ncbi:MAG TPA: hypothetical protein VF701_17020 [Thermoanaerobaculia bacterium]